MTGDSTPPCNKIRDQSQPNTLFDRHNPPKLAFSIDSPSSTLPNLMPTILYAEHHRDDQVLNDLLATLRVADPTQPIQSAAPSANITAAKPKIPASSAPAPGSSSSGPLNSNTDPPPPPGPSERTYTVRGRETGIIDTWYVLI